MTRSSEPPIDLITERSLSKRTFTAMVQKLGVLTTGSAISYDYTFGMLASEYGVSLEGVENAQAAAGRRWRYPVHSGFSPVRYEVTTYGEDAQRRLRETDFTKNLLASVWFNTEIESGDLHNEFGFSLSLLDEPRPFAFAGTVSGQIQLAEGLHSPDGQKLAADAETIGAELIIEHYARADSSQNPLDFRLDLTQEIGSDMVRAFGRLASIEELP